jgi:hypothetical protein
MHAEPLRLLNHTTANAHALQAGLHAKHGAEDGSNVGVKAGAENSKGENGEAGKGGKKGKKGKEGGGDDAAEVVVTPPTPKVGGRGGGPGRIVGHVERTKHCDIINPAAAGKQRQSQCIGMCWICDKWSQETFFVSAEDLLRVPAPHHTNLQSMRRRSVHLGLGVFHGAEADLAAREKAQYNKEAMPRPYVLGEGVDLKNLIVRMHFSHESYEAVDMALVIKKNMPQSGKSRPSSAKKKLHKGKKKHEDTAYFFELRRMIPPGKTRYFFSVVEKEHLTVDEMKERKDNYMHEHGIDTQMLAAMGGAALFDNAQDTAAAVAASDVVSREITNSGLSKVEFAVPHTHQLRLHQLHLHQSKTPSSPIKNSSNTQPTTNSNRSTHSQRADRKLTVNVEGEALTQTQTELTDLVPSEVTLTLTLRKQIQNREFV